MSRVRFVLAVLSAGLTALVLGVLGAAGASAATAPALKVCKKAPQRLLELGWLGLYNGGTCDPARSGETDVVKGAYGWAWPDAGGTATIYCLLDDIPAGRLYSDELCERDGGNAQFSEALLAGEKFPKLEGSILLSVLKGEVLSVKTEIHCTGGTGIGQPETATLLKETTLTYTGCLGLKPANCQVRNLGGANNGTIETKPLITHLQSLQLVVFLPEGKFFVEIEYKEGCGTLTNVAFKLEGTQSCDFQPEAKLPAIDHLLVCKATGSLLKFGAVSATYEGVNHIHLEGLPYWKIQ